MGTAPTPLRGQSPRTVASGPLGLEAFSVHRGRRKRSQKQRRNPTNLMFRTLKGSKQQKPGSPNRKITKLSPQPPMPCNTRNTNHAPEPRNQSRSLRKLSHLSPAVLLERSKPLGGRSRPIPMLWPTWLSAQRESGREIRGDSKEKQQRLSPHEAQHHTPPTPYSLESCKKALPPRSSWV